MRLSSEFPRTVEKYLLPHERAAIATRRHPGIFIGHFLLLGSWCGAACLITALTDAGPLILGMVWGAAFVLLVWLGVRAAAWPNSYFVATDIRLVFITGLAAKKTVSVPLREVASLKSHQSPLGRLVGYGEFIAEPATLDYTIPKMNYLPYLEQLLMEMKAILPRTFPDEAEN